MQQETEIDLLELGYEILDKLKYIIAAAVLGIILAGVYVFAIAVPTYEAVAKLYVLNSNDSVVNLSDLQLGNYLPPTIRSCSGPGRSRRWSAPTSG